LQRLLLAAAAVTENKNPLAMKLESMGDRLMLRGGKAWAMM
jgi:hypothetical protein